MNEKKVLLIIFTVAFFLRFGALSYLPRQHRTPSADAQEYDELALNLLAGKGFINFNTGKPTAWRVPLYPIFLASIYSVFGHNYTAVRIVQCLLGAFLCVLIYLIAKEIFSSRVALIASLTLCFYKPYILYSYFGGPGFLFSENLFTFLLAVFVYFITRSFLPKPGVSNSIIAGFLLGLMALTRPVASLLPLVILFILMLKNEYSFRRALGQTALIFISFALVILPWTARNYMIFKKIIPFSLEGGYVLFASNNPYASGGGFTRLDKVLTAEESERLKHMSEPEADAMFRKLAKDFFTTHYKKLPRLCFKKLLVLWDVFVTDYGLDNMPLRIYNIWYSIILSFALIGISRSLIAKVTSGQALLISLFIYFSIMAMIFSGEPRFRYPIEIYLIVFTAFGVSTLYDSFRNKFLSILSIALICAGNLLFYKNSDFILNLARKFI